MPSIADGDASEDDGNGDNDGDNRNGNGKWSLKEKSGMTPGVVGLATEKIKPK